MDEVTGRLEVNITSSTPFPGPMEVVLTMTTYDGTAEGTTNARKKGLHLAVCHFHD